MMSLDDTADQPNSGGEPEIIMVSLQGATHYLTRGEQYLDQIMLVDGNFPTPILCLQFSSNFDAKRVLGDAYDISSWWAVHPDVVARLRSTNCLTEIDGSGLETG